MLLTKWNPFESLTELESDIFSLFDTRLRKKGKLLSGDIEADWLPAVDIYDDKEAFHFDVEAPGMKKDGFDINVDGSVLTIKGERKQEEEKKGENYYRVEREYGMFARSFTLPDTADTEKVDAEYKNGILKVKVGKKEVAKPKQIPVKNAA